VRDKSCLSKAVCLAHFYNAYQFDSCDNTACCITWHTTTSCCMSSEAVYAATTACLKSSSQALFVICLES